VPTLLTLPFELISDFPAHRDRRAEQQRRLVHLGTQHLDGLRRDLRVRLALALGALLATGVAGCATRTPPAPIPDVFPPFVPDVGDEEWNAAIPAKDSNIASPRLIRGPAGFDIRAVLRRGESARIAVAHIIRANGTVGVYRITASTNPQVTAKVIEMLRAQVYEPPLLMGSPVAVRGEVTYRFER